MASKKVTPKPTADVVVKKVKAKEVTEEMIATSYPASPGSFSGFYGYGPTARSVAVELLKNVKKVSSRPHFFSPTQIHLSVIWVETESDIPYEGTLLVVY